MGFVIFFIALAAILSTTILKLKRMSMEQERFKLSGGEGKGAPLSLAERTEMNELKQRVQNLETIVSLGGSEPLGQKPNDDAILRQQIAELARRLDRLEK